jgi:hypothetical protein
LRHFSRGATIAPSPFTNEHGARSGILFERIARVPNASMNPMKSASAIATVLFALMLSTSASSAALNTLTEEQVGKGWRLLFNGKNLDGWRPYKKEAKIGDAWRIEDGILTKTSGERGGDIMTVETFGDFDLNWEWKIPEGANNGIKYFITEERNAVIGHEYQMLDDAKFQKLKPKSLTASFYDVLPAAADKPVLPAGAWNHSRIFVLGNTVEHWLNGKMVLQYELGSEAVLKAVQDSKFKPVAGFGTKVRGHILLTDHKDGCQFKNIRIREFK